MGDFGPGDIFIVGIFFRMLVMVIGTGTLLKQRFSLLSAEELDLCKELGMLASLSLWIRSLSGNRTGTCSTIGARERQAVAVE